MLLGTTISSSAGRPQIYIVTRRLYGCASDPPARLPRTYICHLFAAIELTIFSDSQGMATAAVAPLLTTFSPLVPPNPHPADGHLSLFGLPTRHILYRVHQRQRWLCR